MYGCQCLGCNLNIKISKLKKFFFHFSEQHSPPLPKSQPGVGRAGSEPRHSVPPLSCSLRGRAKSQHLPTSRWFMLLCTWAETGCDFPLGPEFENTAWPSSSFISSLSLVLIPSGCWTTSPRFELPMGTTEQPPLPQQTQPPTKVPCPGLSSALWHCWPWQCPCSRELSACINVWSAIDPARDFVRGLRRRQDRRGVSHAE